MPISTKNDRLSKRDHITKGAELRDGKNTTIISMLQMVIYFLRMCDASMLNHLHYTNLGMLNHSHHTNLGMLNHLHYTNLGMPK